MSKPSYQFVAFIQKIFCRENDVIFLSKARHTFFWSFRIKFCPVQNALIKVHISLFFLFDEFLFDSYLQELYITPKRLFPAENRKSEHHHWLFDIGELICPRLSLTFKAFFRIAGYHYYFNAFSPKGRRNRKSMISGWKMLFPWK